MRRRRGVYGRLYGLAIIDLLACEYMTKAQEKIAEDNGWDMEAVAAYIEAGIGDDDLSDFEEALQGQYESDIDFAGKR